MAVSALPSFDPRLVPVLARDHDLPVVPGERLLATALRRRFAAPPVWVPEVVREPKFSSRPPANAAVLVPTFNDPADRVALGILAEVFPDRPVVGIHAVDLVWGFGTLHCLTQQQPAAK